MIFFDGERMEAALDSLLATKGPLDEVERFMGEGEETEFQVMIDESYVEGEKRKRVMPQAARKERKV
jgi:hypothetical protein